MPGTDYAKKKMKKAVEATLELVAETSCWPSDEMIASITDLHPEVPRARIKAWFEDKRRVQQAERQVYRERKQAQQQQGR